MGLVGCRAGHCFAGLRPQTKFVFLKAASNFGAPSINLIFLPEENSSDVGGWVGWGLPGPTMAWYRRCPVLRSLGEGGGGVSLTSSSPEYASFMQTLCEPKLRGEMDETPSAPGMTRAIPPPIYRLPRKRGG